jgi:hypothetical protein
MLRRDEICGDLGTVIQECGTYGRSNKSLISLAGAAGLEPQPERRLRCWLKHRKRRHLDESARGLQLLPGRKRSLENLRFRKNERMFGEKSIPKRNRGGIVMADLHRTTRRSILIGRRATRAIISIFLTALLTWCAGTVAAAAADLYRTKVTVTGQGEANRMTGFAASLEDVLIKASGALKLSGDRRLTVYKSKAKDFVRTFSYRDQFFGKPIRDEQGTRDRPFDLTVEFEEGKIDDILKALGLKPWLSHRPRLAVFVEMEQGPKSYIVTADGTQSDLQRDALLAAADKRGMDIVLPGTAALANSNITGAELRTPSFSALAPIAAEQGGEVVLVGRLVWDDRDLGWATQWQMDWGGQPHRWQVRGVTFDEAFRRGIGGAAQVLSGNGDPVPRSSSAGGNKLH